VVRRLLGIALVLEGNSREAAATAAGMDRQTFCDWIHRYNEGRIAGRLRAASLTSPKASNAAARSVMLFGSGAVVATLLGAGAMSAGAVNGPKMGPKSTTIDETTIPSVGSTSNKWSVPLMKEEAFKVFTAAWLAIRAADISASPTTNAAHRPTIAGMRFDLLCSGSLAMHLTRRHQGNDVGAGASCGIRVGAAVASRTSKYGS
jgi:Winged helix-turn helix